MPVILHFFEEKHKIIAEIFGGMKNS